MAGLKNLKKQRRIQIFAVAAIALAVSTGLIGYAMKDGINLFRSPTQIVEEPPRAGEVFVDAEVGRAGDGEGLHLVDGVEEAGLVRLDREVVDRRRGEVGHVDLLAELVRE